MSERQQTFDDKMIHDEVKIIGINKRQRYILFHLISKYYLE
jgi:hypothetical protein